MSSYNKIIEAEIASLKGLVSEYKQKEEELLQQRRRLTVIIDVLSGKPGEEQLILDFESSGNTSDSDSDSDSDSGSDSGSDT